MNITDAALGDTSTSTSTYCNRRRHALLQSSASIANSFAIDTATSLDFYRPIDVGIASAATDVKSSVLQSMSPQAMPVLIASAAIDIASAVTELDVASTTQWT
jgi:predicted patatin/cPLA2 family phospholipase